MCFVSRPIAIYVVGDLRGRQYIFEFSTLASAGKTKAAVSL